MEQNNQKILKGFLISANFFVLNGISLYRILVNYHERHGSEMLELRAKVNAAGIGQGEIEAYFPT